MRFHYLLSKSLIAKRQGMTLIEIMVVLTIIGIIATFVTINVMDRLAEANKEAAKIQIKNISNTIDLYKLTCGEYPSSEDGLGALVSPPSSGTCKNYPANGFLKDGSDAGDDPWTNPYQYTYPGNNNPKSYDLWSMGPDKEDGSEDDIGNWKSAPKAEE